MSGQGWIGFDFDGTLATYEGWDVQHNEIGEPIWPMVELVRQYLAAGRDVRIVTARVAPHRNHVDGTDQVTLIQAWCRAVFGIALPVTYGKDYAMEVLFDDRVVAVETNTGRILGGPGVTGWD